MALTEKFQLINTPYNDALLSSSVGLVGTITMGRFDWLIEHESSLTLVLFYFLIWVKAKSVVKMQFYLISIHYL